LLTPVTIAAMGMVASTMVGIVGGILTLIGLVPSAKQEQPHRPPVDAG